MTAPRKKRISGEISGPRLVEQDHGGALLSGGIKGHNGGTGRPPSAIRELCRGSFAERLEVLTDIADDTEAKTIDRIRAIDLLGKYGGVDKLALTADELPEEADTPERTARLWEMLQRIKNVAELEKLMVDHAKKQLVGAAKKQSASREE